MQFGGFEKFTLIDYPEKIACMVYTIGCPFRCPYCHNPELVDETCKTHIDEKVILDFLDKRVGMLDGIVITGGEPTIHGDNLINFMREVKSRGFLVKLDSNGTDPKVLQKVIDEKLVDYIAMDIKSPLSKYTETVARAVNVEAIKKSVEIIKRSGVSYEFRTTIVKSQLSFDDIEQIGREIKGATNYYLQKFIPTKILNPQFLKKVSYSDEEFKELKTIMEKYVSFCGIR